MNVLMVSGDPRIADGDSLAHARMKWYAQIFDELHIIVGVRATRAPLKNNTLCIYPVMARFPLLRFFLLYQMGKKIIRVQKITMITAQGSDETGIVGFVLARRFHIPFQLQIHTDVMSPWYRRASWKEYARYHAAKFLIPRAACLRVVSQRIKTSILQNITCIEDAKIIVLPIFTDILKFMSAEVSLETEEHFKNYSFKMIAAGRFVDKEKNFSMLIDAMPELLRVCPSALVVLAGDGPDKNKYELRIKNQGLEKYVILEKWRDNMASFYKLFDVFVMPSWYEGWGAAALEAMAAGLVVVMTDVGLAGEVVHDRIQGRVVPVGDRAALADALIELYQHPETRMRYADAGKKIIQTLPLATGDEYLKTMKKSFLYEAAYCDTKT